MTPTPATPDRTIEDTGAILLQQPQPRRFTSLLPPSFRQGWGTNPVLELAQRIRRPANRNTARRTKQTRKVRAVAVRAVAYETSAAKHRTRATGRHATAGHYRDKVRHVRVRSAAHVRRTVHRTVHHTVHHTVRPGRGMAAVVAFARAQVGKRYRHGAAGPSAFDCSGLLMASYRRIGVRLPHSSWGIAARGRTISRAQARPGDLVVGPGHVGIYMGHGMMIDAGNSRVGVVYRRMYGGLHLARI